MTGSAAAALDAKAMNKNVGTRIGLPPIISLSYTPGLCPSIPHLQRLNERLLRNIDLAELPHPLFALFLLVEQLAFARRVAAVAFGGR
jgi:hypothetical protein